MDGALYEEACSVQSNTVTMADEDGLAIGQVIDGAVTSRLVFALVTLQKQGSATLGHVLAVTVQIGAADGA